MKKPFGIKLIAGFLVVWGALVLWWGIYLSYVVSYNVTGSHTTLHLKEIFYLLYNLLLIVCGIGLWKRKKWALIGSIIIFTLIPVSVILSSLGVQSRYLLMPFDLMGWLSMGEYFISFYPKLIAIILDSCVPIVCIFYLLDKSAQKLNEFWKPAIIVLSSVAIIVSTSVPILKRAEYDRFLKNIINNDPQCPDGRFLSVDKENRIAIVQMGKGYRNFNYMGHISGDRIYFLPVHRSILLENPQHHFYSKPECSSKQACLDYMRQCKDKNNKTIFDNFHIIEDAK